MAMGFVSGLPDRFDTMASALDALSDDKKKFTFQFYVSRCKEEEQRHLIRDNKSPSNLKLLLFYLLNSELKELVYIVANAITQTKTGNSSRI